MAFIRFDGRVAIVTGGGNGLGREYCLELGRLGARVVVNDLGGTGSGQGASQSAAQSVVDEIRAAGGEAVANFDSVATREGGAAIVQTALDHFGGVDILINNAGILRNNRFEDLTDDQIRPVLEVHLMGAFHVTQPAYRAMREKQYGRILFTSSASAMFGHPWQANYAAAKGGLFGLSNVVALEGKRLGILSNVLLPTASTRLQDEMHAGFHEVTEVAQTIGSLDFNTVGPRMTPAHNVPLALYLVSEASTETHGAFSSLGGRYARVVVGSGAGYLHPDSAVPSVDTLGEHWQQVSDDSTLVRPYSVYEEMGFVIDQISKPKG